MTQVSDSLLLPTIVVVKDEQGGLYYDLIDTKSGFPVLCSELYLDVPYALLLPKEQRRAYLKGMLRALDKLKTGNRSYAVNKARQEAQRLLDEIEHVEKGVGHVSEVETRPGIYINPVASESSIIHWVEVEFDEATLTTTNEALARALEETTRLVRGLQVHVDRLIVELRYDPLMWRIGIVVEGV